MGTAASQKPICKGLDNYSKSGIFEWYVVRLFNRQHFRRLEWRRSKNVENPQDLVDYGFPDLEWELVFSGTNRYRFAVECKWREKFQDGKIQWADKDKIDRYSHFQNSRNITVFVVIGVGAQPGSPQKVYVMPLNEISGSCEVWEYQLQEYKRKPDSKFYYDYRQGGYFERQLAELP